MGTPCPRRGVRLRHGHIIALRVHHGGIMVSPWRHHVVAMVKSKLHGVWCPHGPSWCRHGGLKEPWHPRSVPMVFPWWTQITMMWPWCGHGVSMSPPWWAPCTMVSPWRHHGSSMVNAKLHGVAPPWFLHGEFKSPWCRHGVIMVQLWCLHGELKALWYRQNVPMVPTWRTQISKMSWSCPHGDTMVPPWWARSTKAFPWDNRGASMVNSKHDSVAMVPSWRHHGVSIAELKLHGWLWCLYGATTVPPW